MPETRLLRTASGRPMPPPPRRTPTRYSSVCRTPTRRFTSPEPKSHASRKRKSSDGRRGCMSNGRRGGTHDSLDPDSTGISKSPNPPRLLLEDKSPADSGVQSQRMPEPQRQNRSRQRQQQDDYRRQQDARPSRSSRYTGSGAPGSGQEGSKSNTSNGNQMYSQTFYSRVHSDFGGSGKKPSRLAQPGRSVSPRGGEVPGRQSVCERLRRSLSGGERLQRTHAHEPSVVGTEILAPMPRLQGACQTSKNRDRKTIERFIECQPQESQEELHAMLGEYRGREEALCEALADAYGDSWDAAVKGSSASRLMTSHQDPVRNDPSVSLRSCGEQRERNGPIMFHNEDSRYQSRVPRSYTDSLQSTPSRPLGMRKQSPTGVHSMRGGATSLRSYSERCDEDVSPKPRRRSPDADSVSNTGNYMVYPSRSPCMLTPPVPQDLISHWGARD